MTMTMRVSAAYASTINYHLPLHLYNISTIHTPLDWPVLATGRYILSLYVINVLIRQLSKGYR